MPILRVSDSISLWTQPFSCQVQFMLRSRQLTFAWLQSQVSHFASLPHISGAKTTWEHRVGSWISLQVVRGEDQWQSRPCNL